MFKNHLQNSESMYKHNLVVVKKISSTLELWTKDDNINSIRPSP